MSLLDEVRATPVRRCSVAIFADGLDAADAADLLAAYDDARVKTSAIWLALRKRGLQLEYAQVRRHRIRGCRCESR